MASVTEFNLAKGLRRRGAEVDLKKLVEAGRTPRTLATLLRVLDMLGALLDMHEDLLRNLPESTERTAVEDYCRTLRGAMRETRAKLQRAHASGADRRPAPTVDQPTPLPRLNVSEGLSPKAR